MLLATCGGPPNGPDPPPPPPPPVGSPQLTCPADIIVDSPSAERPVTFPPPVVTGGTAPITTTCTKSSGDTFPAGTTPVTCTALDGLSRAATCSFRVTVKPTYMLRGTRFTAVGDSITNGEVSPPGVQESRPDVAYPEVLRQMLQARYTQQVIVKAILATNGQTSEETVYALRAYLQVTVPVPDFLVILTGTNDATSGSEDVPEIVASMMRRLIREARAAGVQMVFASTLLPQIPGEKTSASSRAIVEPTNQMLRSVIPAEGGVLVENYGALITDPTRYIGVDGLHPTEAGHRKIAETFFEAIVRNFEVPLAPARLSGQRRAGRP